MSAAGIPREVTVSVWGPPGCGKTTVLTDLEDALHTAGYPVESTARAPRAEWQSDLRKVLIREGIRVRLVEAPPPAAAMRPAPTEPDAADIAADLLRRLMRGETVKAGGHRYQLDIHKHAIFVTWAEDPGKEYQHSVDIILEIAESELARRRMTEVGCGG